MSEPLLDREALSRAFELLGERLRLRGIVGRLYVFGGAAMVLRFDQRSSTRDVDAVFEPDGPILEAAWEVAAELALPRSWLNNQASTYLSRIREGDSVVYRHPFLEVVATSPEHLVALKVRAARPGRDVEDILLLLDHLQISSREEVAEINARFFPDEPLSERSLALLGDLLPKQPDSEPTT